MTDPRDRQPARRLWVTAVLYVLLLAVIVADVWGAIFWTAVGGTLGLSVAGAAVVVILLLAGLLLTDARRQWRRHRRIAGAQRAAEEERPSARRRDAGHVGRGSADIRSPRRAIYRR
ncbi:MAG: hypothetical protein JWR45_48 [Blastococcus sp.]|jgi:hypothetical protein|nr:hypothetical protein [Blastococcus sp.]